MTQHTLRKLKIAALWLAILVAGIAAGWTGYRREESRMLVTLLNVAQRSAVAIDPTELRRLTGTPADLTGGTYAAMKERLQKLRAVDPQVRFVYIFRFVPETGKVIFMADSTQLSPTSLPSASRDTAENAILNLRLSSFGP